MGEGELITVRNVKEENKYIRLVNRWNLISESDMPKKEDLVPFQSRCTEEWMYLERETYEAFIKLKEDALRLGYFIDTDSTYRTYLEQEEVMKEFVQKIGDLEAKKRVSIPGASEHHTGLAIDLVFYRDDKLILGDDLKKTDLDYQWVLENLSKYGFILRYPENSMNTTGVIYEPWHIRYVGKKLAIYLEEKGLLLEEYKMKKKTI